MRILVALGGNALAREGQRGTWQEQLQNARTVASAVVELHAAGHEVIVTHGNGPQVGALAIQQRASMREVPALPLDALVAMTQGMLGYLFQQAIAEVAPHVPTAAVITRVRVDTDDPAFANPAKPIGPYYGEAEALKRASSDGWTVGPDSGRGWRRLVPSPRPLEILECDRIRMLADRGTLVIAGGGGGVPVAANGSTVGVEAVIDKDRTSLVLAEAAGCDTLLMVTGVDRVALDFGTRWQRSVARLTVAQALRHLDEGEFPPGSMGPKVESGAAFAEAGGRAIITSPEQITAAIAGTSGTWIVPDAEGPSALAEAA